MRPSLPLYIGHLHMAQNDNNNLKRPTTIKTTQYLITIDIVLLFLKKSNDKTQQQQFKVGQVTMSSLHDTRSIGAVNPAAIEYPNDDEQSYMDMEKVLYANSQQQD